MKRCPYCGFNNPDSVLVCLNCGRSLTGVKENDFIISPDGDTSYILDKKEELLRVTKKSRLPYLIDVFVLFFTWLVVFIFSLLLSFASMMALIIGGFFAAIFFLFVEFVLLISGEGTFGEIIVKKGEGDRRKVAIFLLLIGSIPLIVALILIVSQ